MTLSYLRQTILLIRNEHFAQIGEWIDHTKSFLSKENHKALVRRHDAVQQLYQDELEGTGLTGSRQASMFSAIKKVFAAPVAVVGFVGHGLYDVVKAIGKKLQSSKNVELHAFKDKINKILTEYIETDLAASENALHTTRARETRLKAMIEYQRQLMKKTEDGMEQELAQTEKDLFVDSLALN